MKITWGKTTYSYPKHRWIPFPVPGCVAGILNLSSWAFCHYLGQSYEILSYPPYTQLNWLGIWDFGVWDQHCAVLLSWQCCLCRATQLCVVCGEELRKQDRNFSWLNVKSPNESFWFKDGPLCFCVLVYLLKYSAVCNNGNSERSRPQDCFVLLVLFLILFDIAEIQRGQKVTARVGCPLFFFLSFLSRVLLRDPHLCSVLTMYC